MPTRISVKTVLRENLLRAYKACEWASRCQKLSPHDAGAIKELKASAGSLLDKMEALEDCLGALWTDAELCAKLGFKPGTIMRKTADRKLKNRLHFALAHKRKAALFDRWEFEPKRR